METLIKEGDLVTCLIEFEEGGFESSTDFKVLEVLSWGVDGEIVDTKCYLKGYIKWDGYSHIWVGESYGYMTRLSGKSSVESHKKVMNAISDICSQRIKGKN